MFSNAVTQFLEVIKPILSRTCFLAYAPELGYSRKDTNSGRWGHAFMKMTPGIFRFATLPLDILDKMKLHHWKFHQIVSPIGISKAKNQDPWRFHTNSFLYHTWKLQVLFYWLLEFPNSIFSILLEISCPGEITIHCVAEKDQVDFHQYFDFC